jgi:molybdopterin molybdotransferase
MEFLRLAKREDIYHNFFPIFRPLRRVKVAIFEALRRFSGQDIISPEDMPYFPRSTVDGFAVKAKDTLGASTNLPSILRFVGEVKMSEKPSINLSDGEALRIWTGGWIPQGADAVVMLENASLNQNIVEVYKPVAAGENVLKVGDDIKKGDLIIRKGKEIRAQEMAILQALGFFEVEVSRCPRVLIIPTGNELVEPWQDASHGRIRETNTVAVAGLNKDYCEKVERHPIVPDNREALKRAIRDNIADYDLIIVSGGSSKGAGDFATGAVEDFEGGEIIYHGVQISPGKPTIFARIKEKPIIGLPGHPVSSFVSTYLFILPFVKYLQGATKYLPEPSGYLKAGIDIPSKPGREDWIRVKRDNDKVFPIFSESGVLSSLVKADGLIRIPENLEGVHAGEEVEFYLL